MNRFLCTSIAQDILNLIIHSTMSDLSFLKCMILSSIFLEALYVCVVYIMVGVTNEWDRPEPAEALMDMPKENSISVLQSRREKGIVAVWVRYRLQSHFLRSVFSRCGIGVKNPCPLRNEYQNQTHMQFWCLNHTLCPQQCRALPGQAHWNGWSFWTKIIQLFLKSKSGLWLRLAWELESTSPNVVPEAHKRGLCRK